MSKRGLGEGGFQEPALGDPAPSSSSAALPDNIRASMERAFAPDFSSVRVHEGAQPEALGALAYAQGDALQFRGGAEQHTAAHEAAHVVQQRAGLFAGQYGGD